MTGGVKLYAFLLSCYKAKNKANIIPELIIYSRAQNTRSSKNEF